MRRLTIVGVIVLASVAAPVTGQEPRVNGLGWIRSPLAASDPTNRDIQARRVLVQLIDEKREDDFRRDYSVDVPDRPTGLPRDYDILIYGQYTDTHARRLEIKVRGDHATAELATTRPEFRRGEFPAEQVDSLTRQLIYAALSTYRPRVVDDDRVLRAQSVSMYATHTPFDRIEVLSRDAECPLHLRTDARQAIARRIGTGTSGVPGFAHSQFCQTLLTLAYEQLPKEPMGPELGGEITRRLRDLKALSSAAPPRESAQDKESRERRMARIAQESDESRANLARIEGLVYAQLVVECRATEALPALERLGLAEASAELRIATADEPRQLLKSALEGDNWRLHSFALRSATTPLTPRNIDLLLESLPRLKDEFRVAAVLKTLDTAKVSESQIRRVREFHETVTGLRSRIAAARFLLWATHDDASYAELEPLALTPLKSDGSAVYAPENDALDALLSYSNETGKRRADTAKLVRKLLDRIPVDAHSTFSHKDYLVRYLGQLGEPSDIPRLKSHVRADDSHLTSVSIHAIAQLDAAEALTLARSQIERYLLDASGTVSFNHAVDSYLHLIFWQRDRASAELLDAALTKFGRQDPENAASATTPALIAKYLRAEKAEDRAQLAVEYVRRRGGRNDRWTADVAKRLIAEGADPKICQPLIETAAK